MAGVPPEQPPHQPYFSFSPGPGMYTIPTQLYCSYPFLLKCLSISMSYISFREQYGATGASSSSPDGHNGFTGTPRPRGPASSAPPGFGMIRAPSAPTNTSTSSSRKSSTPSATVTSQSFNASGSCGSRMFAPPPPLLSPIRDSPPAADYFAPFSRNGSESKPTLSSPTTSSAWRSTLPILQLQQPPSRHQQQQRRPLNLENDDTRNQSSLPAHATSSQMRTAVDDTRVRRRDDGERFSRRDGIRRRSRSRSQNRSRNEHYERSDQRTGVNYHHHHYHRLSPHPYPYIFNINCRHHKDQRRCDYCRDSWNSLFNFDHHASSSSSLRSRRDHDDDNDARSRRRRSREGKNEFKSKSNYDRRDRR